VAEKALELVRSGSDAARPLWERCAQLEALLGDAAAIDRLARRRREAFKAPGVWAKPNFCPKPEFTIHTAHSGRNAICSLHQPYCAIPYFLTENSALLDVIDRFHFDSLWPCSEEHRSALGFSTDSMQCTSHLRMFDAWCGYVSLSGQFAC
jgi:hypothetical protein